MSTVTEPVKFGRLTPAKKSPRALNVASYVDLASAPPPAQVHWATKVPKWGPMLNNKIGDCTFAALGHMVQTPNLDALARERSSFTLRRQRVLGTLPRWRIWRPTLQRAVS